MTTQDPYVILVATDFSDDSALAVKEAWQLATQRTDAQLHLVHVLSDKPTLLSTEEAMVRNERLMSDTPDELRNHAIGVAQAARLAPLHRAMGFHVRLGDPAEAILQLAADVDAEMIVVGSHGKSGLKRAMLGSVSEKLIRTAPLPVLVTRPRDMETLTKSETVEPPCTDCLAVRHASGGEKWWCDLHGRDHISPHGWSKTQRVDSSKVPMDFEGAMLQG